MSFVGYYLITTPWVIYFVIFLSKGLEYVWIGIFFLFFFSFLFLSPLKKEKRNWFGAICYIQWDPFLSSLGFGLGSTCRKIKPRRFSFLFFCSSFSVFLLIIVFSFSFTFDRVSR